MIKRVGKRNILHLLYIVVRLQHIMIMFTFVVYSQEDDEAAGASGGHDYHSADSADADSQQDGSGGEHSDEVIPPSPPGSPPPSLKVRVLIQGISTRNYLSCYYRSI